MKGFEMNRVVLSLAMVVCFGVAVFAQEHAPAKSAPASNGDAATVPAVVITPESTPMELAKAAFIAQGGEKFRAVHNMMLRGSVSLYPPNSPQSIPGAFSIVTANDKLRMEIDARPIIVFKQIYDGQQSYSSMPNVEVPPLSKFGLPVLSKFDQTGYKVSNIPNKKKFRAFRITDPDGYATDFYIDATNGRVMEFFLTYNGLTFGTANSKFKEVDGVLVPFSFSQRFEMPQGPFFAEYSVKEVKINQTLGDDAFAIPR
ncbi:MAG TPA: hypothetical protein VGP83_01630 [Pyrinomonadaceae bacterium]|jgi:hypothetical protein|nr:hypothetical protein [Pyrinomonadaceae bacterium]